jgi:Ca2+-binding EF-hand superfamily protein
MWILLLKAKNKLCVAIKQFIAIRVFTVQDHGELLKAFKQLDVDGDGTLTKEEFQVVC